MSVSLWLVTSLTFLPSLASFFHHTDKPTTKPGRALLVTRAFATNEPRSLKMRTISPSLMPRVALSSGCMSRCGSPSPARRLLTLTKVELRKLRAGGDRKSTRLNSSHLGISYAVFCLKQQKNECSDDNEVRHQFSSDKDLAPSPAR